MKPQSMFVITVAAGFEREARKEVEELVLGTRTCSLYFKGNLFVECPQNQINVVTKLREASTVYLGRIFPVDVKLKISSHKESIQELFKKVLSLGKLGKEDTFLVRCWRRGNHDFSSQDVERELGLHLEKITGGVVDFIAPQKMVIVQIFQNLAYLGITDAGNVLVKSVQVLRKYAAGERPFTRAEYKIKEAIETFDLKVTKDFEVLDLGAAPGGWTKILSSMAKRVVAIDPADLDPSVIALPNIVHFRCRAEKIPENVGQFHLIVNDMNLDSAESAMIMVNLADQLREDGVAIMTVKFVTRNRKRHINDAIKILESKYQNFKVKKLPHNRFETTLFMERR